MIITRSAHTYAETTASLVQAQRPVLEKMSALLGALVAEAAGQGSG